MLVVVNKDSGHVKPLVLHFHYFC